MKVSLTKPGYSVPADLSLMNGKNIRNTDCIREYTPEHIREEYVPQIEVKENNQFLTAESAVQKADCVREYTPEQIREENVPQIEVLENNNLPVPAEKKSKKPRLITKLKDILLDEQWLGMIAAALLCGVLASGLIWFICDANKTAADISEQKQIVNEARAGIIVDKEIVNARSTLFNDIPPEYRIYINCEYEHDGEVKTVKKYFTVSENIYLAYNIGDYFNSQSYSTERGTQ